MLDDGRGPLDPVNLIIEVTGEKKKEKAAKVMTARTLWVPAVNNHGAFGRSGFLEVTDPYEVLELIRSVIGTEQSPPDPVRDGPEITSRFHRQAGIGFGPEGGQGS